MADALSPSELNAALRAGKITYDQYRDGIAAYSGLPAGGAPAASGPAPDVPVEPDQSWMPPPATPAAPLGPAAGSPEEKAQTQAAARDAAAARAGLPSAGGAAAGTAQMQGAGGAPVVPPGTEDPRDAALSAMMSPHAATVLAHALGKSAADKAFETSLEDSRGAMTRAVGQAVLQNRDAVDAFRQQSDALSTESQLAQASFQRDMQESAKKQAALVQESKDAHTRIRSQIDELEAKGINPDHYWQERSTGQKIGAAIAIGLGAFGAHALGPRGGGGGPNTALELIQGAIANDLDAQKTNLQGRLALLGKRMDLSREGFDQQQALLTAERSSIQTAYTVAMNRVDRAVASNKDNAELAMKGQALNAGLQQQLDEKVAAVNEKKYAIDKRAETMVGGSTEDPRVKQIRDRAIAIRDKAAENGKDISPEEARRQAADDVLAVDIKRGEPMASIAKDPTGKNGQLSPRLVKQLGDINAAEQSIGELNSLLRQGSSLSPTDRSRAAALVTELRNQGYTSLPEQPLGLSALGVSGALAAVLRQVRQKKQTLLTMGGAGGGGGGSSPEDLGLEEDR